MQVSTGFRFKASGGAGIYAGIYRISEKGHFSQVVYLSLQPSREGGEGAPGSRTHL